ncbi:hypothetical protein HK099_004796 [Clydaea vesicula]|uniref:Uncharacterized protein n=1 Tax=Clydaea vesicula TaxID=447962 RepID=A0AAD5UAI0_9FUNG|nr:hypothetical protein HK099_004796 [Clydaea vesicula]KAJ3396474.1 hypothetical protein HDU92_002885 [Lobulomyces angularis]
MYAVEESIDEADKTKFYKLIEKDCLITKGLSQAIRIVEKNYLVKKQLHFHSKKNFQNNILLARDDYNCENFLKKNEGFNEIEEISKCFANVTAEIDATISNTN